MEPLVKVGVAIGTLGAKAGLALVTLHAMEATLMEAARSYRFFRLCMQGQRRPLWAARQTLAYRRNRRAIIKQHRLGYMQQTIDLIRRARAKEEPIEKVDPKVTIQDPE